MNDFPIIKAISTLALGEFIGLCKMNRAMVDRILTRLTFPQQMNLRRQIQIALARFAKGKPALVADGGDILTLDSHEIQLRALALCQHIERRVRDAYLREMSPMIIMRYPEFAKNPQKVKSLAKEKWSRFCVKNSY